MKSLKFALLAFALLAKTSAQAQITSASPYCAAGYDDGFMPVDHYISKVSIGTLSNSTGTTQYAAPHYAYYNTLTAPDLEQGKSYTLSVSHDGGVSIHYVAVFIDFNGDKDFDDAGEMVLNQNIDKGTVTNPSTISVSIPSTATVGITRMRVMVFEDDDFTFGTMPSPAPRPCTADATGSFDWGETEDYNVNITKPGGGPGPGPGTSAAPVAKFGATPLIGTLSTNFVFSDSSTNTPTSWSWSFSPNNAIYQPGSNNSSKNPMVKFSANGYYTVKLKVSNAKGADSITKNNLIKVGTTGIEEIHSGNNPVIYPNPANNVLNIYNYEQVKSIVIVDMLGKQLLSTQTVKDQIAIDALNSGMYFIRLNLSDGTSVTQKFNVVK